MPETREFRVLLATDGSNHSRAAIATVRRFPWPPHTRVAAVVGARSSGSLGRLRPASEAWRRHVERVAASARRSLRLTWPDGDVTVVDAAPVDAILGEARRRRANIIVLGWRGHGPVSRLLMGSVSRGVVRRAPCPILVVRRRHDVRTVVVGLDGSRNARKAVAFLAALKPRRGARAVLVQIVEPLTVPSAARLLPGTARTVILREARKINADQLRRARRGLRAMAPALKRGGWTVRTQVRLDVPLRGLLEAVKVMKADLLCVGTRGVGGFERLVLGSVAEGVLGRCPVGVLLVR